MEGISILLIIVPFVAASFVLLNRFTTCLLLAKMVSLGAVLLCLFFLLLVFPAISRGLTFDYPVGGWKEPVGINLYMDGLAWITSLIGMGIALFCLLYSIAENYDYKFYFFFLTLLGGMQGVIFTQDIFNMFVFFEILSIASYILIAYPGKENSIMASFNYLLISSLGIGFYLLGVAILYQETGILALRKMPLRLEQMQGNLFTIQLALLFLVVGIGVKVAFVPFHTWLPGAHAFAPHPVSAVLSGVMIKVSFLAVWRIIRLFQFVHLQETFLWIGAFTAFLGIIWTLAENDSKRLLAYSSVSQMGFIIASFGAATSVSLVASFYHLLNHSLFKSLLFLCIGTAIYLTEERQIGKIKVPIKKTPLLFACFLVGALSISGVPPFNGYVSKNLISYSLKQHPFSYFLILLTSAGTVASFIKLSEIFTFKKISEKQNEKTKKISTTMLVALLFLSSLCLFTGIFPHFFTAKIFHLILNQKAGSEFIHYSFQEILRFILTVGLGSAFYLFIRSQKGEKILKYIKDTKFGISDSLLLFLIGFLLLFALSMVLK